MIKQCEMIQLVDNRSDERTVEFSRNFLSMGLSSTEVVRMKDDYTEWCRTIDANTKKETVNSSRVITNILADDDRIVGIIDFRHTLNDFLKDLGRCGYNLRNGKVFSLCYGCAAAV